VTTGSDSKEALKPTKIWKCKNGECKAWVREEFAASEPECPICKGPMLRSIRHLPAVQNKAPRKPRAPKTV